jgi:hypothetical protein
VGDQTFGWNEASVQRPRGENPDLLNNDDAEGVR